MVAMVRLRKRKREEGVSQLSMKAHIDDEVDGSAMVLLQRLRVLLTCCCRDSERGDENRGRLVKRPGDMKKYVCT